MFRTILLELFLPLSAFKETVDIWAELLKAWLA